MFCKYYFDSINKYKVVNYKSLIVYNLQLASVCINIACLLPLQMSYINVLTTFNKNAQLDDIAMVYINDNFSRSSTVTPLALPFVNQIFDSLDCSVIGWGPDDYGMTLTCQFIKIFVRYEYVS